MNCKKCKRGMQSAWCYCPFCGESSTSNSSEESTLGSYGAGVRAQVFEVIVRQAVAAAPWREICVGPMQVNSISPDEIEAEVRRRQGGAGGPPTAPVPKKPAPTKGAGEIALLLPMPSRQLLAIRTLLLNLSKEGDKNDLDLQAKFSKILFEVDSLASALSEQEQAVYRIGAEALLQQDLERENFKTRQAIKPKVDPPPHHI